MVNDIVLIPGFRKCGTTSLYDVLASTEKFRICDIKEPQLLIADKFREDINLYTDKFKGTEGPIMDGSTYYIWEEKALAYVKENFSQAKAIVMIRNPIDRFYSAYYHNKLKYSKSESRTISEVIKCYIAEKENEDYLRSILDLNDYDFFRRNGLANFDFKENGLLPNFLYINEGIYREKINNLKKIGIDCLVITFEEFVKEFDNTMETISNFINLKIDTNITPKKSNQATQKSKVLIFFKKYIPGIKKVIPRLLRDKLVKNFRKEIQTDKTIDRDLLEKIYSSEVEYWKKNLDGAKRYW
ncbi:sulfotransferase domain-containing protein [Alteromonas lipolytica]|uniref:Sulfotransferase domain-containing protein n=1 Tax=Alteromonas lipolytica TaxID=1856405 RepID=A0A1E8FE40_9ALTE|nr:sulfotransferase domain-containing protein [Alteromonas lipolytica]OFI33858.1 hypothetical protein BFC17_20025 [Alteromonas lipolytica]GGF67732.1 hypothetical protein GCM10011338_19940 [Alteromonas lipolytica]